MTALAVVLVALGIRLACLWRAQRDPSYLDVGRGTWRLAAELLPVVWVAVCLLIGVLVA